MEILQLAIKYCSFQRRGISGSLYGIRTSERNVIDILQYKFLKFLHIYNCFIYWIAGPNDLQFHLIWVVTKSHYIFPSNNSSFLPYSIYTHLIYSIILVQTNKNKTNTLTFNECRHVILKITSYPITNDENIHRRQLFPQATKQWNKEIQ